ncbi:MAG TPA: hypothetical protein VG498_20650 [Terriglobales bacterium]|nr:hypothetical protein [Terriglobales bacterium]
MSVRRMGPVKIDKLEQFFPATEYRAGGPGSQRSNAIAPLEQALEA